MADEVCREQVVVLRDPVPVGEEAQVDYERLGMWTDPVSSRRRTVWAFVMVLCCSRHLFVWPTLTMDQRAWTEAPTSRHDARTIGQPDLGADGAHNAA
jgi:transposase